MREPLEQPTGKIAARAWCRTWQALMDELATGERYKSCRPGPTVRRELFHRSSERPAHLCKMNPIEVHFKSLSAVIKPYTRMISRRMLIEDTPDRF